MQIQFMPSGTQAQVGCALERLALFFFAGYRLAIAAKSAIGFGDPESKRRTSADHTAGAFFVPAAPSYGGCAWETFGSAGSLLPRFANLRTAATHNRLATVRGSSSAKGALPMSIRTLNPSCTSARISAYKARALSALRANSSLSVRLARYNSAMAKARALAAEGANHE
ncbi:MAG: hypothetical protein ACRBBM_11015 [Pseudomonadaceae bacterium]|jgi:hypothetical protein